VIEQSSKGVDMNDFINRLDRADHAIAVALCFCGGVAVTLMMLLIVTSVVSRQFFATPLGGVTEIVSVYDMVAVTFLPLAYVTRQRAHIAVQLFTQALSARAILIIEWLALIFIAIFSIWVCYQSAIVAMHSFRVGEIWESGDGFLLIWPSRFLLPIGIGAVFLTFFVVAQRKGSQVICNTPIVDYFSGD
jgi:TRAP-type C4-dicarboxylate transport system permease small subunit